jgi:hypothetical protein
VKREVAALDHALVVQNRRSFEHVSELANVSRPAVREKRVARFVAQTGRRTARQLGEP